jgi:hypothetical protein
MSMLCTPICYVADSPSIAHFPPQPGGPCTTANSLVRQAASAAACDSSSVVERSSRSDGIPPGPLMCMRCSLRESKDTNRHEQAFTGDCPTCWWARDQPATSIKWLNNQNSNSACNALLAVAATTDTPQGYETKSPVMPTS